MPHTSVQRPGTARLGDFTTDRRLFPLLGLGICAGTFGVISGWILLRMIWLINNLVYYGVWSARMLPPGGTLHSGHPALWTIFVPFLGAIVIGLMARFGSDKIRGHGIPEAIESIMLGGARLDLKVAILKPISSAISIGTGGPFGAEGPIIMTGGAAASLLGQCFSLSAAERKTVLVAGACAGMTAIFGTPLAAMLLAIEVLLFELKPRSVLPVAIACITAAVERGWCMTPVPLFPFSGGATIDMAHAAGWIGIGLIAGLAACLLTLIVYGVEDAFEHLPVHWMWWPALGAVIVGIGGWIDPTALGVGYPAIGRLMAGALTGIVAMRLILVKGAIWSVALGSGTSGGVLAPLLIVGGGIGAVLAPVMPHAAPGFWAVLAMAATLGSALGAPLTATLFAVELTGNHFILLPVFSACMASMTISVLLMKRSILTEKIARRGHHLNREYSIDPLTVTRVREIMRDKFEALRADMNVEDALQRFLSHEEGYMSFPVTDIENRILGMVTRSDILIWIRNGIPHQQRLGDMLDKRDLIRAYPEEMVDAIAAQMLERNIHQVPVIDREEHLVGLLSRADLLHAYNRVFITEKKRERFFMRKKTDIPPARADSSAPVPPTDVISEAGHP